MATVNLWEINIGFNVCAVQVAEVQIFQQQKNAAWLWDELDF